MKEHLTIEHLAGYLPYKLQMKYTDRGKENIGILSPATIAYLFPRGKPLLHPLDRLTDRTIDVWEVEYYNLCGRDNDSEYEWDRWVINLLLINNRKSTEAERQQFIERIPNFLITKFNKYHFDWQLLISKGLALPKPIER